MSDTISPPKRQDLIELIARAVESFHGAGPREAREIALALLFDIEAAGFEVRFNPGEGRT